MRGKSELERALLTQIRMCGLPEPELEYKAIEGRRYRWDFYFRASNILVEVQGGIWLKDRSGHSSGSGIERDTEKLNLATLAGYRVMQFTGNQIRSGTAIQWLRQAIERRP